MIDANALAEMICLEANSDRTVGEEAALTAIHVFNGRDGTPPQLSVS